MVFRRNQGLRLRPVNRIKHVIDVNGGVTGAGASISDVLNTVDSPDNTTLSNQVETSSLVKAIYLRVEVIQGQVVAGGVNNIYLVVFKNPNGNLGVPVVDAVGISDKRKFVIHQEMVMTGNNLSTAAPVPRILFKGVIKIPQPYQRNGINDKLQVIIGHRTGEATQKSDFCLQCIYQEFR